MSDRILVMHEGRVSGELQKQAFSEQAVMHLATAGKSKQEGARHMKSNKILGILLLLIFVCVATALLNDSFIKPYNLQNLLRSSSMFAIIGIGAVLVIVTGGIDLSTGSLIGLVGCTMTMTLQSMSQHPPADNGAWFMAFIGWELVGVAGGWMLWNVLTKQPLLWGPKRGWPVISLVVGLAAVAGSFLCPEPRPARG